MVEIHIGQLIEERLNEVGMTKSEFARRINRARQNINDILGRKSIDTDLLYQISKALSYNFFKIYCGELEKDENISNTLKEPEISHASKKEMEHQLREYKNKLTSARQEIQYLQKINTLLEDQIKGHNRED